MSVAELDPKVGIKGLQLQREEGLRNRNLAMLNMVLKDQAPGRAPIGVGKDSVKKKRGEERHRTLGTSSHESEAAVGSRRMRAENGHWLW